MLTEARVTIETRAAPGAAWQLHSRVIVAPLALGDDRTTPAEWAAQVLPTIRGHLLAALGEDGPTDGR